MHWIRSSLHCPVVGECGSIIEHGYEAAFVNIRFAVIL